MIIHIQDDNNVDKHGNPMLYIPFNHDNTKAEMCSGITWTYYV